MKPKKTLTAAQRFQATRWLDENLDSLLGMSVEKTAAVASDALGFELAVHFVRVFLRSHPRAEEIKKARPERRGGPRRSKRQARDSVEIAEPLLDALASLGRYDGEIVTRIDDLRMVFQRSRLTTNLRKPRTGLLADDDNEPMPLLPGED